MNRYSVDHIIQTTGHRPYHMPQGKWKLYQEWHEVIMAHWKVPVELVRNLIPSSLELDLYKGEAWVSLLAFRLKKMRGRLLPAFPPVSDFFEINMRTYVQYKGKPGIYFFSLEAEKKISAFMARYTTGLPYSHSDIIREGNVYQSKNKEQDFYMYSEYRSVEDNYPKTDSDKWLTERYCLFHKDRHGLFEINVHHLEWPLQSIAVDFFQAQYCFGELHFKNWPPDRYHYSKGIQVLTWGKKYLE